GILLVALAGTATLAAQDTGVEYFEKKIRPVLMDRCYKCHSAQAEKLKGGLRLDTREDLLKGGESGPAIVPGSLEKSRLVRVIRYYDEHVQTPPKEKLSDTVTADFEAWIRMGAPDPRSSSSSQPPPKARTNLVEGRKFWSFQPPQIQPLPKISRAKWAQRRI